MSFCVPTFGFSCVRNVHFSLANSDSNPSTYSPFVRFGFPTVGVCTAQKLSAYRPVVHCTMHSTPAQRKTPVVQHYNVPTALPARAPSTVAFISESKQSHVYGTSRTHAWYRCTESRLCRCERERCTRTRVHEDSQCKHSKIWLTGRWESWRLLAERHSSSLRAINSSTEQAARAKT